MALVHSPKTAHTHREADEAVLVAFWVCVVTTFMVSLWLLCLTIFAAQTGAPWWPATMLGCLVTGYSHGRLVKWSAQ